MKTLLINTLASVITFNAAIAANQDDLVRLYEEEILAHDLYVELGKTHPEIRPFKNIPHSEARHREAMEGILKAAGVALPDPKNGRKFVTPGLDRTYKRWLKEGKESSAAACRVGVRLEEHDIMDLRKASVDFPAYKDTLKQLEWASGNHLRAFHRNLVARNGDYSAELMDDAELTRLLGNSGTGPQGAGCGTQSADKDESVRGTQGNGPLRQRRRGQANPGR